jgi:hypothetical protein
MASCPIGPTSLQERLVKVRESDGHRPLDLDESLS